MEETTLGSCGPPPSLHKYANLKRLKFGKAAFPKLWKYHDAFALLLHSSIETRSWLGETWLCPTALYVLHLSSIASLKFIEKFTSINQVFKLGPQ